MSSSAAALEEEDEEELEYTLFMCREVRVYKVPPMMSGGVRSGEWKVADEIWKGRLRVIATGNSNTSANIPNSNNFNANTNASTTNSNNLLNCSTLSKRGVVQ